MSPDIVVFKLTNGEEIIARAGKSSGLQYELQKPRVVMVGHDGSGKLSVQLMPWSFANPDADMTLNFHAVASGPFSAAKQLADVYVQNTTGIALASTILNEKK